MIDELETAVCGKIAHVWVLGGGGEGSLCSASFDRGDPVRIRHGIRACLRPLRTGVDGRFVHVDDESAGRGSVPANHSGLVGTIADDLDLAGAHHRVQRLNGRQQRRVSGDRRFSCGKCGESLEDYILGIKVGNRVFRGLRCLGNKEAGGDTIRLTRISGVAKDVHPFESLGDGNVQNVFFSCGHIV